MAALIASLPLDVWEVIWERVRLRDKAKLELCSSTLRSVIWDRSPVRHINTELEPISSLVQVLATKPKAGRGLRGFVHPHLLDSALPIAQAFKNTTALTHVYVWESIEGGTFNALAGASCPLKNLTVVSRSTTFFTRLDVAGFEGLRPTLRRLALFRESPELPPAPLSLLTAISLFFGATLEALSLSLDGDWSLLKPMTALTELYIESRTFDAREALDLARLALSVARLGHRTPAGVGVNVVFIHQGLHKSFLSTAARESFQKVRELVEKYGADPNLAPFTRLLTYERFPVLFTAINEANYEVARFLIEKGAKVYFPRSHHVSAFRCTLLTYRHTEEAWTAFASYLFDEIWPKVMAEGKISAQDLLGFPPSETLVQLFSSTPSTAFPTRSQFVVARPGVFGEGSVDQIDAEGCNFCHLCASTAQAEALDSLGVDWRVKDAAGLDALECLALRGSPKVRELFVHWCKADDDFLAHCTHLFWGSISADMTWSPEGYGRGDRTFKALVDRMVRLVPSKAWEPIIAASLHVSLREGSVSALGGWLGAGGEELRPYVVAALFRPWRDVRRRRWFRRYCQHRLAEKVRKPLPQVVNATVATLIGQLAKAHFETEAEARAWLDEPYKDIESAGTRSGLPQESVIITDCGELRAN